MRKIAVFTGTRSEYGLLYWIISGLQKSPIAELQLIVGGMHLSKEFGYTISQIRDDGFKVSAELDFLSTTNTHLGISKSMSSALISASNSFESLQPDLLVILGDRYESFAVAQAAMLARIPIAHIHGGEITEGLIDEAIRHSLTKMSHLHFSSTDEYSLRIQQLGENPNHIFNFGAPGIDNINKLNLLSRKDLSELMSFNLTKDFFIVTHHPVTLLDNSGIEELQNLLSILDEYQQFQLVISYPNADANNSDVIKILRAYAEREPQRIYLTKSLGQLKYLSCMSHAKLVIGNSSSGIIEAPSFKIPTINIGSRQRGRVKGKTIISCDGEAQTIKESIELSLSKKFRDSCQDAINPYGDGNASELIVDKLIKHSLENILIKKFFDVGINS